MPMFAVFVFVLRQQPLRAGRIERRWQILVLLVASVLAGAVACAMEDRRPKRVVLITLDTLRQDAFRRPGDTPPPLAKTLARARRGLIFERYYSVTASTQPSHATLFTGLQPWQHGVSSNGAVLDAGYETVAERLKAEGFRTAAAVASHAVASQFGFAQGFDHYFEDFTHGDARNWEGIPVQSAERSDTKRDAAAFYSTAEVVSRRALRFLDELGGDKQFFWFHFFDAHAPYGDRESAPLSPRKVLAKILDDKAEPGAVLTRARNLYDSDVRFLDQHLDALMEKIARDGSEYETHLLVAADHGESMGEQYSMGHGTRLTEATLRTPLFVLSPSVAPGVRRDPVGTIDLTATLLALAGSSTKLGDSRNLLAPAAPARPVAGMRRTFETPYEERRLDGSVHTIDGLEFYAIEEGQIVLGDREGLTASGTSSLDATSGSEERLVHLFSGFEATLRTSKRVRAADEEDLEKLKALGYVP
jgi:arylsulfatase A-like enzyme